MIGRAVHRIIYNSMRSAKPSWEIKVPKQQYRNITDLIIRKRKCHAIIKIRTTRVGYFRYSSFDEAQLSVLAQFHKKHRNNLALLFFYFADEKALFSVDIEDILDLKQNKFDIEDVQRLGFSIYNWNKFGKYLDLMVKYKGRASKAGKRCAHHWLIESPSESMQRSGRRKYSMGYCKYCGKVKLKFENFVREINYEY